MSVRDFIIAWQSFWFKPQSPLPISLFRIVFGIVFFMHIATQYWTDFSLYFGEHPVIPYDDFVAFWFKRDPILNLFELVPTQSSWHIGLLVATAIFDLMMTVGLFTRFSTFCTYLLYISICHQYPFFCNAGDNMQRVVLFLLIFTKAGEGLSLDAFLKNRKGDWRKAVFDPPPSPPWGQRMLQIQLALAYFSTGLIKINSRVWFYGNGCYMATRLADFMKLPLPEFLDHRVPLYLMNWFAIIVELSLGTLIWVRELRYWIILAGVILHLGIDWALNIPIFEFVFMSMYILFIDADDIKKVGHWFKLFFNYLWVRSSVALGRSS